MPRYAVNVADLTYDEVRVPAQLLVGPLTKNREQAKTGPNLDDISVVLETDDEKRAQGVCSVLNANRPVRCYVEGKRGGWKPYKPEMIKKSTKTTKKGRSRG
jgi:hypothetical protein